MTWRTLSVLVVLLTSSVELVASQTVEQIAGSPKAGVENTGQTEQDLAALSILSASVRLAINQVDYTIPANLSFAAAEMNRDRPRWLFPVVGAAVGGTVLTYVTIRACQGEDCIFPVGPPLIGIGLGALLGWGLDAITRSEE
jgi:hypothetical protein